PDAGEERRHREKGGGGGPPRRSAAARRRSQGRLPGFRGTEGGKPSGASGGIPDRRQAPGPTGAGRARAGSRQGERPTPARAGSPRRTNRPLTAVPGRAPGNFGHPLRSNSAGRQIRTTGRNYLMNKPLIALTLSLVLGAEGPAAAAPLSVTHDDQREVMVTIYNGNLGLVKDLRETRLPAGVSEVQFMDVAAQIDPTTVHLKSLTDAPGLKILEQNY